MGNYEDPRWQRLRLEVFQRDGWQCVGCGDASSTLVAHHKKYVGDIWDSPPSDLQTVCKQCHEDFGRHPKGGVWWENEQGVRVLHVEQCPLCASTHFVDKGAHIKCHNCEWRSDFSAAVTCHGTFSAQEKTPVLFGSEICRVYLAGKMADPWRDELITNGEGGWSCNNHGIHGLLDEEEDGAWSVLRGVVSVPGFRSIDLCGPYWNPSLDPWGGHGHAGLVDKHSPQTHACGAQGDWCARYLTSARCRRAINRCDLFFAWINTMDAFGTLVEIGLAVRAKCRIVVALGPNTSEDLWFATTLADGSLRAASATEAWRRMWSEYANERPLIRNVQELLAACVEPLNLNDSLQEHVSNG